MDVCTHYVCLYSFHVYSLVTYAMNVCISFSRDMFYECVYSLYILCVFITCGSIHYM